MKKGEFHHKANSFQKIVSGNNQVGVHLNTRFWEDRFFFYLHNSNTIVHNLIYLSNSFIQEYSRFFREKNQQGVCVCACV